MSDNPSDVGQLGIEQAQVRLFNLGFYCIEAEITPDWAVFTAWRKYQRSERIGGSGSTPTVALARLVERCEEESERSVPHG